MSKRKIAKYTLITDNPENKIESIIQELSDKLIIEQASVMIGAGFSRNAKSIGSKAVMPSLLELGEPFYKKLNGGKLPPYEITDISDVQDLAAEIEDIYERTVLDEIIEKEIPDKEFEPSILHTKLFEFPWSDVYTTNYDTLLERASSDKYKVVIRGDDLRFTHKHRIIKLHGSFLSCKPYIITKKDFASYPKKYKIFVNMIQTSLVEKMFLLIGFAGADPNFLSWIKWLRNALTAASKPTIYFIGVGVSEKEINSLKKNNIKVVDILLLSKKRKINSYSTGSITRTLTTDDYKEAYLAFFNRLSECLTKEREDIIPDEKTSIVPDWPEKNHIHPYPEDEIKLKFTEVIHDWKTDRENYPGWIVLSKAKRKLLSNFTDTSFIYSLDKLGNFLDIKFLFEFNWRLEKYLHPLFDDWAKIYKKTLDKYNPFPEIIKNNKKIMPKKGDRNNWIELNFALLKYYRQEDLDKDWQKIAALLEKIKHKLNPEQKARYHYERCHFQMFYLNPQMIRKELSDWKENFKLPYWEAKRAGIIAELGDVSKALDILNKSLKIINNQIKAKKQKNKIKLLSQQAYMLVFFDCIQRSVNYINDDWSWEYKEYNKVHGKINELKKYECSPWDDLDYFEISLKYYAPDYKNKENSYGFKLNSIFSSHKIGSDVYTINAYKFFNYIEETGFPLRMPGINIFGTALKHSIKRLQNFSTALSLIYFIRAKDERNIDCIFSRKIITIFPVDFINELILSLINILKRAKKDIHDGDLNKNTNLGISISSIVPEILGRLSIKASFSARKELLSLAKSIYLYKDRNKYKGMHILMEYLVSSFSNSEKYELINTFLEFPILSDTLTNKFPDPFNFILIDKIKLLKGVKVDADKVDNALTIAESNNELREKALVRLLILWRFELLTDSDKERFGNVLWKFTDKEGFPAGLINHYYYSAFLWFPHPENINPDQILRKYLNNIQLPVQTTNKDQNITITNGNILIFGNIIGTYNKFYKYSWSQTDINILIDKITDWWNSDKKYLIEDNYKKRSETILNEFKARFNNMLTIFACIIQPNIEKIGIKYINKINSIILELKKYYVQDIMARAVLVSKIQDTKENIITDICNGLYSKDEDIIHDAITAVMVLLRQKCENIEKIISVITLNIKCRTDIELHRFILFMNTIVCDYPEYINEIIMNDIGFGLHKLVTETVIDKESTDKDIHSKQMCRKHSVELASLLKNYCFAKKLIIPEFITEWENVAHDPNEVAEIRNAWLS
jgi:hypothetical protein